MFAVSPGFPACPEILADLRGFSGFVVAVSEEFLY